MVVSFREKLEGKKMLHNTYVAVQHETNYRDDLP